MPGIPVLVPAEGVVGAGPAGLRNVADHVEDPLLPLPPPLWVRSGQDCGSVDVVSIMEVMIVIKTIPEVTAIILEATGAHQTSP